MKNIIRSILAGLAAAFCITASTYAQTATDVAFQFGVYRRAVENSGADSAWLFRRPIASTHPPSYVIYRNDRIAGLAPGDIFRARLDIAGELNEAAMFVVHWEETAQASFRSLHGYIQSTDPGGARLGTFRFTMRLGGSELTGCVQIQDRDYCFIGKNGVGWIS